MHKKGWYKDPKRHTVASYGAFNVINYDDYLDYDDLPFQFKVKDKLSKREVEKFLKKSEEMALKMFKEKKNPPYMPYFSIIPFNTQMQSRYKKLINYLIRLRKKNYFTLTNKIFIHPYIMADMAYLSNNIVYDMMFINTIKYITDLSKQYMKTDLKKSEQLILKGKRRPPSPSELKIKLCQPEIATHDIVSQYIASFFFYYLANLLINKDNVYNYVIRKNVHSSKVWHIPVVFTTISHRNRQIYPVNLPLATIFWKLGSATSVINAGKHIIDDYFNHMTSLYYMAIQEIDRRPDIALYMSLEYAVALNVRYGTYTDIPSNYRKIILKNAIYAYKKYSERIGNRNSEQYIHDVMLYNIVISMIPMLHSNEADKIFGKVIDKDVIKLFNNNNLTLDKYKYIAKYISSLNQFTLYNLIRRQKEYFNKINSKV